MKKSSKFEYLSSDGKILRDKNILARITSLHIPPAWTSVWICTLANGHLQATGLDSRNRKQYRYHPRWAEVRDEAKYDRVVDFGYALPKIHFATDRDLQLPGMPKEKVLATIVQLLEKTLIRVGNEEYAKENQSFGLTTMHDKHVKFSPNEVSFIFKGKSGVKHAISLHDPRLVRIIRKCQELPGYHLFQYVDSEGDIQSIESNDVNEYIQKISDHDFTAKDFRTWSGTVLAAQALQEFEKVDTETQAKKNIVAAIETVAKRLGNTKAVCRKCYVHPAIINAYLDGSLVENLNIQLKKTISNSLHSLPAEEAAVVVFLQKKLDTNKTTRND